MDRTRVETWATTAGTLALETALQVNGAYTNQWLAGWLALTAIGSAVFIAKPHWAAIRFRIRSPILVNSPEGELAAVQPKEVNEVKSRRALAVRAEKELKGLNLLQSEYRSRLPTHPDYIREHGHNTDQWQRDLHRTEEDLMRRYMTEHHDIATRIVEEARLLGAATKSDAWQVQTGTFSSSQIGEVGQVLAAIAARLKSPVLPLAPSSEAFPPKGPPS